MQNKKSVLSCIQPTGNLHLGRYFGAVENWVKLQDSYNCVYGVVDYHAMTMPFQPEKLRQLTWEVIFNLMACGIKEENLFVQSLVPEHAELGWILGCMCSYGELSRMTQFKDKTQQVKESDKDVFISSGLFTYPILQAADILIYKADFVPVGKDQEQHLELTRNIANRFNQVVGKDYFQLPEPLFSETPKIMSTADPLRKMSASLGEKHNIDVFAEENILRKQIKSAVTDAGETPNGSMSAGVENLFLLLKAAGNRAAHDALMENYSAGKLQYGELKTVVADTIVSLVKPIQEKKQAILAEKSLYKEKIQASSAEIRKKAQATLREVKELAGLVNIKK